MKSITQITATFILGIVLLSCENTPSKEAASEVTKPSKTIHESTFFGDLDGVKQHIEFGTDLNIKDEYGSTPLNVAITFGKSDIARALINAKADLTATTADGSTPLHAASLFGRVDIVKLLLQKKVDMTVRNSYGSTAYETAATPFEQMKPVYDQLSRDLGPFGLKLDYEVLQANRITITEMLDNATNNK